MPSPIILSDQSGLAQGITGAGNVLAQALNNRFAQQKQLQQQKKYQTILGEAMSGIDANSSPAEITGALNRALGSGLPIEYVQAVSKIYEPLMKEKYKEERQSNILKQLGFGGAFDNQNLGSFSQPMLGETAEISETVIPASQSRFGALTEDQLVLAKASGVPMLEKLADGELKRRELQDKKFVEERKFHSGSLKESEKKISNLRESLPKKKMALLLAEDAVNSGEVGAFSAANIAERTGLREFQNVKGAQLATAGKENLLSNMSRVSARGQNQWFEQRLASIFPQIGQSKEANLAIASMIKAELAMDEAYLSAYDRLSAEDEKKYGYVRKDIEQRAQKETERTQQDIFNRVNFDLRNQYEKEKFKARGESWLNEEVNKKVPKGTYLTPLMAMALKRKYGSAEKALENAKKLGYIIPTEGEFESWQ